MAILNVNIASASLTCCGQYGIIMCFASRPMTDNRTLVCVPPRPWTTQSHTVTT